MNLRALFRRSNDALTHAGEEQAEKLLAEGFRALGQVCGRIADYLEAQRLSRAGYDGQGKFLERLDQEDKDHR